MSVACYQQADIIHDVSRLLGCKPAERFLNDVALPEFTADVVQCESLQHGDVILRSSVSAGCTESIEETGYGLYPQVNKLTLGMVKGPCCQKGQRSHHFAIGGSLLAQMEQILSHPYTDTSETLETCNDIKRMLEDC